MSEIAYYGSTLIDDSVPIHIEVLLPAFVLGCIIAYPKSKSGSSEHDHDSINTPAERRVSTIIAAVFMVLVGLSMPIILNSDAVEQNGTIVETIEPTLHGGGHPEAEAAAVIIGASQQIGSISAAQPSMSWALIAFHVLMITIISNLGKMFPAFCYRKEAHWRERVALSIGMWPRGEVGAGVLIISLSYGIGGPIVTIAMLSLALNLLMTGLFIYLTKQLTASLPNYDGIE